MRQIITALCGAAAFSVACAPVAMAGPPPPPTFNWTGFYAGVNAGYGWGNPSSHVDDRAFPLSAPLVPGDYNTRTSGFIGGLQGGYNYQMNAMVVGVETDIQFGNINGTTTTPSTILPGIPDVAHFSVSEKVNWLGTLRGRFGFLPMSNLLLYGTGGLAYGGVKAETDFQFDTGPFANYHGSTTKTKAGWTVGGGAEWALTRMWSVKAEYLYYDLGTISVIGSNPFTTVFFTVLDQKVTGQVVRLGVNYKFGQ